MLPPTHDADAASILINLPGYRVLCAVHSPDGREVLAGTLVDEGACPGCDVLSSRVQARPVQTVTDVQSSAVSRPSRLRSRCRGRRPTVEGFGRRPIGPGEDTIIVACEACGNDDDKSFQVGGWSDPHTPSSEPSTR